MNPLEILQSVKKIVFGEEVPTPVAPVAPVEKVFSEYQLKDGTAVSIDKLEVGGVVMVGDAPAPVGSHELSDGTMLEVGEGGMIAAVTAPMSAPEDMNAKYESRFSAIEQNFATITVALQESKQEVEHFKVALSKADEAIKGLVNLVETMVKTPETTPSEPVKSGFRRDQESKEDKLNRMFQNFKTK